MILNVKQLSLQDSDYLSLDYHFIHDIQEIYPIGEPGETTIHVKGSAKKENGLLTINVQVMVPVAFHCDRCFIVSEFCFSPSFTYEILENKIHESEENFALVREHHLNLNQLIITDLILNFPVKLICELNCRGMCAQCGENLNQSTCSCTEQIGDSRLAALSTLLD